METKQNLLMVPSLRVGGLVAVDWTRVTRRLQKSQRQIDRARRRASRIERILYKSFTATAWLWVQQGGKCPCCGKPITWLTGWSKHHIVPKSQGGTDALVNLQLLHPDCHVKLHQECDEAFISRVDDIREAQNLLAALKSCLDRLGVPLPADFLPELDVYEGWDRIRIWLDWQVEDGLTGYIKPDRRVAA